MKKAIIIVTIISIFTFSVKSQNYTILPSESTEVCPLTNITFSCSLNFEIETVTVSATGNGLGTVIQAPATITWDGTKSTFTFVGKFADRNEDQGFKITWAKSLNQSGTYTFVFTKVKSFYFPGGGSYLNPVPNSIVAPKCQQKTQTIYFANATYYNSTSYANFGTVSNYEYLLPSGWKLGTALSNGTNWLPGSNNETVTSDAQNGDGSGIQIRAVNNCGSGLVKGPVYQIPVFRPWPVFVISPVSVSLQCGYSRTVTFTVTNQGTFICPVSYKWYLGANNNWLDVNNNPVQSTTFTTTSNSLILKSVAAAQSYANIQVTPVLSGTDQPVLTSSVTLSTPNYALIGPTDLCNGTSSEYSIYNAPAGCSVSWTAITKLPNYGTTVVQVNTPSALHTTLTQIGSGVITLHAYVTNPCGQTVDLKRDISVGGYSTIPVSGYVLVNPPNGNPIVNQINTSGPYGTTVLSANVYQNTTNYVSISNPPMANATWSLVSGNVYSWYGNGTNLQLIPYDYNSIQFRLTSSNQCGSQYYDFYFYPTNLPWNNYSLYPNPVVDEATVSVIEAEAVLSSEKSIERDIREIIVVDKTGVIQSKHTFGKGIKQAKIKLSKLQSGVYVAKISDGQQWDMLKFVKQ